MLSHALCILCFIFIISCDQKSEVSQKSLNLLDLGGQSELLASYKVKLNQDFKDFQNAIANQDGDLYDVSSAKVDNFFKKIVKNLPDKIDRFSTFQKSLRDKHFLVASALEGIHLVKKNKSFFTENRIKSLQSILGSLKTIYFRTLVSTTDVQCTGVDGGAIFFDVFSALDEEKKYELKITHFFQRSGVHQRAEQENQGSVFRANFTIEFLNTTKNTIFCVHVKNNFSFNMTFPYEQRQNVSYTTSRSLLLKTLFLYRSDLKISEKMKLFENVEFRKQFYHELAAVILESMLLYPQDPYKKKEKNK